MARFGGFSKYGAKKTVCGQGHQHDSKREAARCDELHDLWAVGQIANLEMQKQFWFCINGKQLKHRNGRRVGYLCDFAFIQNGKNVAVEVKGFSVRDWPLRRAIFEALFPEWELREL